MSATIPSDQLPLQRLYFWERTAPDRVAFTQPTGGGPVRTYTWREVVGQARRMAGMPRATMPGFTTRAASSA